MTDENTYNALLKQVDDLLAQNQRLQDHVDTHHKYFEELHELAKDAHLGMDSMRYDVFNWSEFAKRVFDLTHPNAGERG